jgi:hypothetical protein
MQNIALEKLLAVLAVVFCLIVGAQTSLSRTSQQERQVKNVIPKHVPIEVKITKEKEKVWKDPKNENWAKDFEIEITNTGDRPIYALVVRLYFDVPDASEDYSSTDIAYGRREINNSSFKATADDVPIKPGESKRFTIQPESLRAWEYGRRVKGYRLSHQSRNRIVITEFRGWNWLDG